MTTITKTIGDPNAPERLRGKEVVIVLDEQKDTMDFRVDVPDDATANELGYLRWAIGEFVDSLREDFPFIGGQRSQMLPEEPK